MRRKSMMLVAVAAALALAAAAASTATAAETLSFVSQSGRFPLKGVTLKGGEIKFTTETESYGCSSSTGEGEITGHKTAKMTLSLKGCRYEGTACHNHGTIEEIKTESLPVELVYTSKEHDEAGLDFNYQEPTEKHKQLVSWECTSGGNIFTGFGIRGSIISAVTPVNTSTLTHTVKFTRNSISRWVQSPTAYETEAGGKFEALPEMALLGSEVYREGSLTSTIEVTTTAGEGKLEIKA
jgi:hypothetical protein